MNRQQRIEHALRDHFTAQLAEAFFARFKVEIETSWNIFSNSLVTSRADDEPLSREHFIFIAGFENGWLMASAIVRSTK